jgi:hypothetical protein
LPSPILTPAPPPIRIRRSIRRTGRCRSSFDNWFDPIESELRARAREFIEEMIRGELDTMLARRWGAARIIEILMSDIGGLSSEHSYAPDEESPRADHAHLDAAFEATEDGGSCPR